MRLCGRRTRRTKWYCLIFCVIAFRRRFVLLCGMLALCVTFLFLRFSVTSNGLRGLKEFPGGLASKDRTTVYAMRRFGGDVLNSSRVIATITDRHVSRDSRKLSNQEPHTLVSATEYFPKAKLHRRKPWPVKDWASSAMKHTIENVPNGRAKTAKPALGGRFTTSSSRLEVDKQFEQDVKSGKVDGNRKYLIYICDRKVNCYGFADRQRGIVSTYLLAELTNRTFGLIMTVPAPLENYYIPNLVNWMIPQYVFKGKSTTELSMLGRNQQIDLSTININENYPEDIVFVRTNRDALHMGLELNPHYRHSFPKWALGDRRQQFALGWLRLMLPSMLLRQEINNILSRIAKAMLQEHIISQRLQAPPCLNVCNFVDSEDPNKASKMSAVLGLFDQCLKLISHDFRSAPPEYTIKDQDVYSIIQSHPFRGSDGSNNQDVSDMGQMRNLCLVWAAIKPRHSPSEIQMARHYDFLDLDLVCVHIRLGKNPSMPLEKGIRNTIAETDAVWNFLRPYLKSGRHVFLASDSEQVRQLGKEKFGRRVHVSEAPVVHIDKVNPSNENLGNLGLQLALTEQLVLMTSCRTLVVSESGFSQRAAFIRRSLVDIDELFLFRDGSVVPWPLSY